MGINQELLKFIFGFWFLLFVAIKALNLIQHRKFSDGPSLIPVIPIIPLSSFLLGWLINLIAPPWGLYCIVALHLSYLAYVIRETVHPPKA
jgi:hypothetical protein